jgi:hypothetical protein
MYVGDMIAFFKKMSTKSEVNRNVGVYSVDDEGCHKVNTWKLQHKPHT